MTADDFKVIAVDPDLMLAVLRPVSELDAE
jgi:hypothetical protein